MADNESARAVRLKRIFNRNGKSTHNMGVWDDLDVSVKVKLVKILSSMGVQEIPIFAGIKDSDEGIWALTESSFLEFGEEGKNEVECSKILGAKTGRLDELANPGSIVVVCDGEDFQVSFESVGVARGMSGVFRSLQRLSALQ